MRPAHDGKCVPTKIVGRLFETAGRITGSSYPPRFPSCICSTMENAFPQERALVKMIERQRMQQAAADAAKKLKDATKDVEETARVAVAQTAPGDKHRSA
jgi:hypothetical protein